MKYIRRLYNWVLHWAETPWGPAVLFFLSMAESSVFPIPPDVLLMALALGAPKKAFYFATICTVGSVLGGMLGYLIGFQFWHLVGDFFLAHIFSESFFLRVKDLYNQNAFFSIFVSGFTPIPYKVFTLSAGVFELNFMTFTTASILGRGLRFFLVSGILFYFGPPVKKWIDDYFEWLTILFTILLIGGFVVIKWVL